MTQIRCENLSFRYDNSKNLLLDDLSINLSSGQIISLVGSNGSGKTTILKILSGLLTPIQGKVFYGVNEIKNTKMTKHYVNLLPENAKLFLLGPTVLDEFLHVFKTKNEVETFLISFKLEFLINKRIYDLSEGQRRLIAILSALVQKKEFFFLDEPTIGLDFNGRRILLEIIHKIKDLNGIVLIATNDTRILQNMDRIICLKSGKIVIDDEARKALYQLEEKIGLIPNQITKIVTTLKKKGFQLPECITAEELNTYLNSLEV